VSPLSDAVTAQATVRRSQNGDKKVGRQLSVASNGNHYADAHRHDAETLRALNGQAGGLMSPTGGAKEGFFSHLRKRARRFSGRYQTPISPAEDIEAAAGCGPWPNNRQSSLMGSPSNGASTDFLELDKALQNVRTSLDAQSHSGGPTPVQKASRVPGGSLLKRHHSVGNGNDRTANANRKAAYKSSHTNLQYETPDEGDELLDEALNTARKAARRLDKHGNKNGNYYTTPNRPPANMYLTPSPSANRTSVGYDHMDYLATSKPVDIKQRQPQNNYTSKWPTPPYEESDWAASAAASILAAQAAYR
jgi:meiosis induction protein kinase IME2/SME1